MVTSSFVRPRGAAVSAVGPALPISGLAAPPAAADQEQPPLSTPGPVTGGTNPVKRTERALNTGREEMSVCTIAEPAAAAAMAASQRGRERKGTAMIGIGRKPRGARAWMRLAMAAGCTLAASLALQGTPASAAVYLQNFSTPGNYSVTVPAGATSLQISVYGGSGVGGSPSGSNTAAGGGGGSAGGVAATFPVPAVQAGDTLSILVGAQGGGGAGGPGDEVGGAGGAGGGASAVTDTTSSTILAVAGGGGGGGGGGGAFLGYNGGTGGVGGLPLIAAGAGQGVGAGAGGTIGTCGGVQAPGAGGAAATASDAGGGGGGGGGACVAGGGGGGSTGGGGGGGGAPGANSVDNFGASTYSYGTSTVSGDGHVVVRIDYTPPLAITSAASDSVIGSAGSFSFAVTANGEPAPGFSLSGQPSWVSIDPASGLLSGTIPPRTVGRFTFTITATNGAEPTVAQEFTLVVTAPALVAAAKATQTIPVGLSRTIALTALGGIAPYTWSLASGALPTGLTLHANGTITGTPTRTGTFFATFLLTDSATPARETATVSVAISVVARPVTITTLSPLPPATVGTPYTTIVSGQWALAPVHWSVSRGALPAGLALNPATGAISGTPTTAGTSTFTLTLTDATKPTALSATKTLSITVSPKLSASVFVGNSGNNSLTSYTVGASGDAHPLTTLAGSSTTLSGTEGLAIDRNGTVYVVSADNAEIAEFTVASTGNTAPSAVIQGLDTGLTSPIAAAVDGSGRLYVANHAGASITEYAPGARGDAVPLATISGPDTQLSGPNSLTIDPGGNLWVADAANRVIEFAPGAAGDATPLRVITGPDTGLNGPDGMTIDAAGNLLVTNLYGESLEEYHPSDNGDATPVRTIAGPNTGLALPQSVDIDATGTIYVANEFGGVSEFAVNASGNATPTGVISGADTALDSPWGLAVVPPLWIRTARLPRADLGRRYAIQLRAALGTTPYQWHVTGGRLPRGLRLTHEGRLVGRPGHRGLFRVRIAVRDHTRPAMRADRWFGLRVL